MALLAVTVIGLAYVLIERRVTISPAPPQQQSKQRETKPVAVLPALPSTSRAETTVDAKPLSTTAIRPLSQEVKVALALHRAGADLGEPVEVSRDGSQVIVTGTALPPARREELLTELAGIAGVSIRWEDARIGRNPSRPNANFDAGRLPWQAQLETVLGGKAALERTSNQLLDLSDSITARSLALKKLDEQFVGASGLSADERRLLDGIAADHRKELARLVAELSRHSMLVFAKLGVQTVDADPGVGPLPGIWQAAQKTDQLLNVLFAGTDSTRTMEQTVEELRIALARLTAATRN